MNKNRKAKLAQRATQYAQRYDDTTLSYGKRYTAWAYEDGYRACMRDMRKLNGPRAQYENDADYAVAARRTFQFLRPFASTTRDTHDENGNS